MHSITPSPTLCKAWAPELAPSDGTLAFELVAPRPRSREARSGEDTSEGANLAAHSQEVQELDEDHYTNKWLASLFSERSWEGSQWSCMQSPDLLLSLVEVEAACNEETRCGDNF